MSLVIALALSKLGRDGAVLFLWGAGVYLAWLVPAGCLRDGLLARLGGIARAAAGLCVLAVAASLPLQAAGMGEGLSDALDPHLILAILRFTTIGLAFPVQMILALLLLGATWRWQRAPGAVTILAGLLCASLVLSGHGAMHAGWLGVAHRAIQALHLLAGGFWLGAMVPLLATLHTTERGNLEPAARAALQRFSLLGHAAVALLLLAGPASAYLVLLDRRIELSSLYQRLLLAKIALVLAMTLIALANRYVLLPRLRGGDAQASRSLYRRTQLEIALGLATIALVAVFSAMDP